MFLIIFVVVFQGRCNFCTSTFSWDVHCFVGGSLNTMILSPADG